MDRKDEMIMNHLVNLSSRADVAVKNSIGIGKQNATEDKYFIDLMVKIFNDLFDLMKYYKTDQESINGTIQLTIDTVHDQVYESIGDLVKGEFSRDKIELVNAFRQRTDEIILELKDIAR